MNKKLVLYGAGDEGKKWLEKLGSDRIWRFIDSNINKAGTMLDKVKIVSLPQLIDYKDSIKIFISVSEKYIDEIKEILFENHMHKCIVDSPYSDDIVRFGKGSKLNVTSEFEGENYIGRSCSIEDSYIGYSSYLADYVKLQKTVVGKYCAIAEGVSIIRGQHPSKQFVSIHPAFYSPEHVASSICYVNERKYEEFRYTKNGHVVEIGNDVWIGKNVQLMEGIIIGDGAIIAAGSIVISDVEPYTIVGGIPAKWIRNRFSESDKIFLSQLKWWNKPQGWLREHAQYFSDIKNLRTYLEEKQMT